jgi:hypothetical protein
MNKKAKLPNRQTFVNPAGIGVKREDFYFWYGDLVVSGKAKKHVPASDFNLYKITS